MSLQALFDFITDPTINENNMDEYLDIRMQEANKENDPQQQIDEAVFKQAYIPQTLTQVSSITINVHAMCNFHLYKETKFLLKRYKLLFCIFFCRWSMWNVI